MARCKSQKVAYVVFRGYTSGVYNSWKETQEQVHGYPGNNYRGFTVAEGGRKRAEDEFKKFLDGFRHVDDLPTKAQNSLRQEETERSDPSPIADAPYTKMSLFHDAPRISKRKRTSTNGKQILSKEAVTSHRIKEPVSNGEHKSVEPALGRSGPDNSSCMTGPGKVNNKITNGGSSSTCDVIFLDTSDDNGTSWTTGSGKANGKIEDQGSSSKCDVILLDESDEDKAEAEFNDASLDEFLTNAWPAPNATEPPLCKEQADLVSLILSGRNTFYTGSAGCGKSTVLKAFVRQLRDAGKRVHIVAPTGRAALDINGSTTWTFAGWTPDHMKRPLSILLRNARGKFVRKRLQSTDVLVIDEISMVENHHFERLNAIMKEARESSAPFGGIQIIVTGDFCQLPPVKPFAYCYLCGNTLQTDNEEIYTCAEHGKFLDTDKWAFKSKAWAECNFAHVNLTSIHRQSDLEFIRILERCRLGKPLFSADRDILLRHACDTQNAVRLFPTREKVRELNDREFRLLTTPIQPFDSHDDFKWNEEHPQLNSKGETRPDGHLRALDEHRFEPTIRLRKDMQVVLLVNLDLGLGLVNGSQGVIVDFAPHSDERLLEQVGEHKDYKDRQMKSFISHNKDLKIWPVVRFTNGVERIILAHCTVNELGDTKPYSLLSRTQIPLAAAWAMTVHKSQGMTLSRVIVDLARSFEAGQEYVALSRAKSLDGLKVLRLGNFDRGADNEVKEFLREKFGIL